jgi:hypothetical protein
LFIVTSAQLRSRCDVAGPLRASQTNEWQWDSAVIDGSVARDVEVLRP